MDSLSNVLVGALVLASVYSLVGSGFVVLFKSTGVLNFAQGAFMAIGALIFASSTSHLHLGLVVGLCVSVASMGLFASVVYWVVFARLRGRDQLVLSIATIGLGTLLQMIANMVWGSDVRRVDHVVSYRRIVIGPFSTTPAQLTAVAIGVVGVLLLSALMRYTRIGLRMQATADSAILAEYVGARPSAMSALAWGLAGAAAGAAGTSYSIQSQLDPTSLVALGLAAFPAIILGGIDSLPGVALGAILVGLVQSWVGVAFGGEWQAPAAYLLLVVVVVLRPRGLMGTQDVARI